MLDELNLVVNSLRTIQEQLTNLQEPLGAIPEAKTTGIKDYYKELLQVEIDKLISLKEQI